MKNTRSAIKKALTAKELSELEFALNQHPAVLDAVVIRRNDVHGEACAVAYVVPADIRLVETLWGDLKNVVPQQPDACVFLASMPIAADGVVDREKLEKIEVIDEGLINLWKRALNSADTVAQVELITVKQTRRVGSTHRMDLLQGQEMRRGGKPVAPAEQQTATCDPAKKEKPSVPAMIHGDSLAIPEGYPKTLGEMLRYAAERHSRNGVIYVHADGAEEYQSYPQLLKAAGGMCAGLSSLGLQPGDKVILQLQNNREFLVAFWACILGGMIPVPVSIASSYIPSNATVQKLINAWHMLDEPLILANHDLVPELRAVFGLAGKEGVRIQPVDELGATAECSQYAAQPDDLTLLLLTSGSTGMPKAVMHSHRTLLNRSASAAAFNQFGSEDISLNWMPLDHVGGIVMFHLRDVFTGCMQIHVSTAWVLEDPLRWLDMIDRYRVTVTWAPNFAYALIADQSDEIARRRWDLSSMRFMLNGGEAIVARTARRFLRLLAPHGLRADAMHPAWGMSETASGITYSHNFSLQSTSDNDQAVEVGAPIPNTSLRIVDANNRLLAEGDKGRLQVRGASIMLGYYRNPEMNQKVFTPDGWLDTGDLGVLRDGRLTVTARIKDEIIINGINYPAQEIEAAVDSIDGVEVSFSAACAVRRPGNDTDELVVFFSPSATSDKELAMVLKAVRNRVATDMGIRPTYVVPLGKEQIPKTEIGKIQRSRLKQQFEEGEFDESLKHADLLTDTNTIPDWFFRKVWYRKKAVPRLALSEPGRSLVLIDDLGLGAALCGQLRSEGQPCVVIEAGAGFIRLNHDHYKIDPANRDHYHLLAQTLRDDGQVITRIVHLWTYGKGDDHIADIEEFVQTQYLGVYSVLFLVQALAAVQGDAQKLFLTVASSGSQIVFPADACSCRHATTVGLLKTIPLELDWIGCRHVDLEAGLAEVNANYLLDELHSVAKDDEVAYRNGCRLVWGLAPVDLGKAESTQLPLKSGGIYLITGGLGGIGGYLARILMRDFQAKLILVGTTRLPERAEWPACLEQGGRLAERIQQYLEIEATGGEFVYASVDVSDLVNLREAVQAAEARWNEKLAGVFHLAVGGDIRSHWEDAERHHVLNQTSESFDSMFRSKVYGSWALDQIVNERPESIMVSFGSVIGVFGAARFAAYAAAHTFLGNFSLWQRYHQHARSYHFAWAVWDEIGLSKADPAFAKDFYRAMGYFLISKEAGLDCLIAGLCRNQPNLIVGLDASKLKIRNYLVGDAQPLQKLAAYFTTRDSAVSVESESRDWAVQDRFGTPSECEFIRLATMPLTREGAIDLNALLAMQEGRDASQDNMQPRTEVEEKIAAIWREILGISRFGIHDSYFQLGGNSLNATQVLSRLRRAFRVKMEMRDLFEHATICSLAKLIELGQGQGYEDAPHEAEESFNPDALLANVDNMSDEQVAELLARMQGGEEL